MSDQQPPPPGPTSRVVWIWSKLRGSNLAGLNLDYSDFRASDISGTNFSGSSLRYCDFRGCEAVGTNFQNTNLYGSKMQGINAREANFQGANVEQCNLGGAYLDGAMLPQPQQAEKPRGPSPSEIGRNPKAYLPEQQPQQDGKDRGRDKGRGR